MSDDACYAQGGARHGHSAIRTRVAAPTVDEAEQPVTREDGDPEPAIEGTATLPDRPAPITPRRPRTAGRSPSLIARRARTRVLRRASRRVPSSSMS